ncbi:M48 family metalloprotease [Candidatus Bathyarchaeota archaeon]|nr:M48 family metalloprotease [Candidatus Bathyarchaeota archaeon]
MNLIKLRMSILGTLTLLIAVSTLCFAIILAFVGITDLASLAVMVVGFNLLQWLFAPYMINAMYRVREISEPDDTGLRSMVARLSDRIGLRMPKVMIADIPIPNAFAYGSPIAGSRVAVTTGLLKELEDEEVEAVLGHELGHLKNRDVQVMMFASVLPAIFYFIGYSMMMSAYYGGRREREGGGAAPMLIGMVSMAIYYVLTLLVLGLSRLREYYADQRSISIVEDGARKLSEALAKIVSSSSRMKLQGRAAGNLNSFKALFIEDPDSAVRDEVALRNTRMFRTDQQLVQEVLSRKVTAADRFIELLSTHPNIVKRLQAILKSA